MDDPDPPAVSRGDEAREALITAAIAVFGERGFSAASTRSIAQAAGANAAMISYYFGGKQGLYRAAVAHIAEQIGTHMRPVAERVAAARGDREAAPAQATDRRRVFELVWELVDALLTLLCSERSEAWARLILREQQEPSEAFDILFQGIMVRVLGVLAMLVADLDGARRPGEVHRLRALTVMGHALVFRAGRAATLRFMGWNTLGEPELEAIRQVVRLNLTRMLDVRDD